MVPVWFLSHDDAQCNVKTGMGRLAEEKSNKKEPEVGEAAVLRNTDEKMRGNECSESCTVPSSAMS